MLIDTEETGSSLSPQEQQTLPAEEPLLSLQVPDVPGPGEEQRHPDIHLLRDQHQLQPVWKSPDSHARVNEDYQPARSGAARQPCETPLCQPNSTSWEPGCTGPYSWSTTNTPPVHTFPSNILQQTAHWASDSWCAWLFVWITSRVPERMWGRPCTPVSSSLSISCRSAPVILHTWRAALLQPAFRKAVLVTASDSCTSGSVTPGVGGQCWAVLRCWSSRCLLLAQRHRAGRSCAGNGSSLPGGHSLNYIASGTGPREEGAPAERGDYLSQPKPVPSPQSQGPRSHRASRNERRSKGRAARDRGSIRIYFTDLKGKAMHLLYGPLTAVPDNWIINNDWVVKQEAVAKNVPIVLFKLTLACNEFERLLSY